jgi:hypothetical protein
MALRMPLKLLFTTGPIIENVSREEEEEVDHILRLDHFRPFRVLFHHFSIGLTSFDLLPVGNTFVMSITKAAPSDCEQLCGKDAIEK